MVVGMLLSAVFVAGPGLINARTISKPVRVYTSSTEKSICTLNFSICIHTYARVATMSHMYMYVTSMHVMYCDASSRHHWKWFMRHY